MEKIEKIIFAGKRAICREPMAAAILQREVLNFPVEILARGFVVLFPEPLNQKAEAVMISNGITLENYTSSQLESTDFGETTLILTFDQASKEKVLEMEGAQNVEVLTDLTGDELEILDPYGAELVTYGICYETLSNSIHKLAEILNEKYS
ncbi:phosphotyrosine protein phosphatase [uncultured Eubacterium sp.]|uniref:arsenate reductase/protein-tyrosine-phosphatase family protein n=1 Tax=uncultured Eubacterium sp. TaxID=165185 RepID=UPI0025E29248|nr:phosphotyrosine protein phosphatase [uncultured Eubacterium sp.]